MKIILFAAITIACINVFARETEDLSVQAVIQIGQGQTVERVQESDANRYSQEDRIRRLERAVDKLQTRVYRLKEQLTDEANLNPRIIWNCTIAPFTETYGIGLVRNTKHAAFIATRNECINKRKSDFHCPADINSYQCTQVQ